MMNKLLSVIIPAYNEGLMIKQTSQTIHEILSNNHISHEIIFIDDGSKDTTWSLICEVSQTFDCVKGIHFSRNFGKESAIMAGLKVAKGDCGVVIDCDLQHPPVKILEMYKLWLEGYEIIEGQKSDRGKESVSHRFMAKLFYNLISKATDIDMSNASDFKLLDRKAINALLLMPERDSFFRALSSWIGYKTTVVEFEVQDRVAGETKWSTYSLIKYALNNITSFSTAPMQIVTVLGGVMLVFSIILGALALIQKILGQALEGFTTVILILLFSGSIIMISLGIIGFYIAKIYEEIKARPRYLISNTCGMETYERTIL